MKKNLMAISLITIGCLYGILAAVIILAFIIADLPATNGIILSLLIIVIQFLVAPVLNDFVFKVFYNTTFDYELPEYLREFIQESCEKHSMKYPKIGFIDDGSPNAFTYGRTKNDARVVITRGVLELLDEEEVKAVVAHELGHAYHGQVCLNNAVLNRDYPMQLAETASIFCQTLMAKKMINDITDPYEKLTVIEESLQEDTQCVIDILSRFLFEEKVLSTEVSKPLSATDMCEMMLEAQEESYGEGLDKKYRHPYMWLCKSHYYSASLNYYNFPYAFGLLYGKGLYKQYLKNKDDFVKKYDEMLMKTGYMMVEDVTMSMGIDVTKKDFWIESLKFIEEDIDEFASLLVATGLIKDNK